MGSIRSSLSQPVDTDVTTRSRNRGSLVGEQHTSSSKKNASTFATSETLSLSLELISGALLSIVSVSKNSLVFSLAKFANELLKDKTSKRKHF